MHCSARAAGFFFAEARFSAAAAAAAALGGGRLGVRPRKVTCAFTVLK